MKGIFEQVTILFFKKKSSIHSLDQFENQINEINDLREYDTEGCTPCNEFRANTVQ